MHAFVVSSMKAIVPMLIMALLRDAICTSDSPFSSVEEPVVESPITFDIARDEIDPRCAKIECPIDGVPAQLYLPASSHVDKITYKKSLIWERSSFGFRLVYALVYMDGKKPKVVYILERDGGTLEEYHIKRKRCVWIYSGHSYKKAIRGIRMGYRSLRESVPETCVIDVSVYSNYYCNVYSKTLYEIPTFVHIPRPGYACTKVIHNDFVFWEAEPGQRCIFTLTLLSPSGPNSVYLLIKNSKDNIEHHYHKNYDKWIHVNLSKSYSPVNLVKSTDCVEENSMMDYPSYYDDDVLDLYRGALRVNESTTKDTVHRVYMPKNKAFTKVVYGPTVIWDARGKRECIVVETFSSGTVFLVKLGIDHESRGEYLYFEQVNDTFLECGFQDLLKYKWLKNVQVQPSSP